MTPNYPKRLIEVDLPIKRISAHARREKSIRHGHISTLHIWWARRPLAACRAVICASLWPDPADPLCPQDFRDKASKIISEFANAAVNQKELGESCDHETWIKWQALAKRGGLDSRNEGHWNILRFALLDFIADFANWDNSTVQEYLDASRALTQAAHEALGGEPGTRPLVVDPFAGGGSIPLEALRVGADAFASDLNPIPVLLNKVVLEYIPKYGQRLADEVRKWGEWIKKETEKDLARFYPKRLVLPEELRNKSLLLINAAPNGFGFTTVTNAQRHLDSQGGHYTHYVPITSGEAHGPTALQASLASAAQPSMDTERRLQKLGAKPLNFIEETPIAYLWARTIQCEGPGCGAEVPLIRSLWLAKRANRQAALQLVPRPESKCVDFRIIVKQSDGWVDQARPEEKISSPTFDGTVKRGSATCPCCGYTTSVVQVRRQFKTRRGGANDARLMAVVQTYSGEQGRSYRLPTELDLAAIRRANAELDRRATAHRGTFSYVPDEPISLNEIRRISPPIYGMATWGDLFTGRQSLALASIANRIGCLPKEQDAEEIAAPVQTLLACALDRQADYNSTICRWVAAGEFIGNTFGRQAIPMVWDFCEVSPLSLSTGGFSGAIDWIVNVLEREIRSSSPPGHAERASSTKHPLPSDSADAIITDPPYYDSVPYSHLADFFYVWLRRSLGATHPDLFRERATPKLEEIVVDRPHELSTSTKGIQFYESELTKAFCEGQRVLRADGVGTIVFASKTTASWEAILKAVVDAGWIITGSWPIDTEMEARIAAQGQARLASSVHLVCRPREKSGGLSHTDEIGDWRDVLLQLPLRIHEWMPRLAREGVVGADAIFACLGPALEVFSRYSRVEKASGEPVLLGEYLEHVWAAVAKEALALVFEGADATGFEADARLTAMWLWTLKTPDTNGNDETDEEEESSDDEPQAKKAIAGGFKLEYDAARKIAQGLGAHLESLTHLVEVSGDQARLLPVSERTRHLFGKDEEEPARAAGKKRSPAQLDMFAALTEGEDAEVAWKEKTVKRVGETTLDRVHQAMILFAASRGEALKRFVVEDGVGQDGKFWRLADAFSALYPAGTDEKRWVDGVLARKKQFGF